MKILTLCEHSYRIRRETSNLVQENFGLPKVNNFKNIHGKQICGENLNRITKKYPLKPYLTRGDCMDNPQCKEIDALYLENVQKLNKLSEDIEYLNTFGAEIDVSPQPRIEVAALRKEHITKEWVFKIFRRLSKQIVYCCDLVKKIHLGDAEIERKSIINSIEKLRNKDLF